MFITVCYSDYPISTQTPTAMKTTAMKTKLSVIALLLGGLLSGCEKETPTTAADTSASESTVAETALEAPTETEAPSRFDIYSEVTLSTDLSQLSDAQRQMVGLLIDAAKITEDIFWLQVWGDKEALLNSIDDPKARNFAEYNFGPWDRLANDQSFIESSKTFV